MTRIKKQPLLILILLALFFFIRGRFLIKEISRYQGPRISSQTNEEFLVTRIIDGDTIGLETGEITCLARKQPDKS